MYAKSRGKDRFLPFHSDLYFFLKIPQMQEQTAQSIVIPTVINPTRATSFKTLCLDCDENECVHSGVCESLSAYNEIDESHLHPISQVVIERKRSVIPQSSLSIVTLSANHFLSGRLSVR
jgi:hypothetical protein